TRSASVNTHCVPVTIADPMGTPSRSTRVTSPVSSAWLSVPLKVGLGSLLTLPSTSGPVISATSSVTASRVATAAGGDRSTTIRNGTGSPLVPPEDCASRSPVVIASPGNPPGGMTPAAGGWVPVSTAQLPFPSAWATKLNGPLPGAVSVTVTCEPGVAVPVMTGVGSLVSAGDVTAGVPGGEPPPPPSPPPPPPPPPASASRPRPASAGLPENSASGAVGVAIDGGAYRTKLPSASAATGSVSWSIVSPRTPPSPSRSREHGALGVQVKKKSVSRTVASSGSP